MRPKQLLLELDGPGVGPTTIDSLALLQLSEAFFRLTSKVAEGGKLGLSLRGLEVIDKCVAVAVQPSNLGAARLATARVLRIVKGDEDAPSGAEGAVDDVRRGLRMLPPTISASVRVGKAKPLRLVARAGPPGVGAAVGGHGAARDPGARGRQGTGRAPRER